MKKGLQQAVVQQMGDEGESFRRLLTAPAAREAFTAFMEKRRPNFSGL
jgi:enoyl-CoA hydratase/carnithine racemase